MRMGPAEWTARSVALTRQVCEESNASKQDDNKAQEFYPGDRQKLFLANGIAGGWCGLGTRWQQGLSCGLSGSQRDGFSAHRAHSFARDRLVQAMVPMAGARWTSGEIHVRGPVGAGSGFIRIMGYTTTEGKWTINFRRSVCLAPPLSSIRHRLCTLCRWPPRPRAGAAGRLGNVPAPLAWSGRPSV